MKNLFGQRISWRYRTDCDCRRCLDEREWEVSWWERTTTRRMILCQLCGNKRCPHATDHSYDCTNSNEPGQKGSIYECN